jgi:tight adherence protein C
MSLPLVGLMLFLLLSIFLGVWSITTIVKEFIRSSKGEEEDRDELFSNSVLFRGVFPLVRMLSRPASKLRFGVANRLRGWAAMKLKATGKQDSLTPDEFIAIMMLAVLIGLAVGFYVSIMLGSVNVPLVILCTLICMFLPVLGLRDMVKRRHEAIRRNLPYAMDLLTLSVEAGLDFTASLSKIAEKMKENPLTDEIKRMTREISMGKTRSEALKDTSERVQLEELNSIVAALVQADELGSSLGPTLRIQSESLRTKRSQLAEKLAMEAPVKLLFPLICFIFPLVFMVIFGPLVLKFVYDSPFK